MTPASMRAWVVDRPAPAGDGPLRKRHLFQERQVRSVTANTRADGQALLDRAAAVGVRTTVSPYPFDRADAALADLAADRVTGAAVIEIRDPGSAP